ncbi:MAG: hypothetical protein L0H79_03250 [Intrasporangium sp.]|uniref:hypothetical protein n=1 Tax=Intrasporangium sp. TaxID=1925024 RepID=UPI00264951B3|nr:hypothetical protein [Intrasporangium sp.]MDN5794752.1 hypothetical protein [Intrasporangium sp.]
MDNNLSAQTSGGPVEGVALDEAVHAVVASSAADRWQGFPGARITGVCAVVAPPLAVAASALGIASYHAAGQDFVAGMVAHPTTFGLAIQVSLASLILLLIAVAGVAGAVAAIRPGLGRTAGLLTVIGLCGPISFQSIYWAASQLTDTGAHRAAAAVLIDESQVIPRTVMNVSGPALVVGFVLLAVATARSGLLSPGRAVLLGMAALMPFGFISGHLLISVIAFAGLAAALVPLGWPLLVGHSARAELER